MKGETEIVGGLCQIELNRQRMFTCVLCFLGWHVTAAVEFELEMVACVVFFCLAAVGSVQACPRSDSPLYL